MSRSRRPYTVLHTEASRGWGGQERRIVAEAREMQARGHRLWIGADPCGQIGTEAGKAGLSVVSLNFSRRRLLAAVFGLRRLCRDLGVDILNTHSSLDSWAGLLATRMLRPRPILVRTRHLSTPISSTLPTRWLYRTPSAIITTSEAISSLIAQTAGVPQARLFTIPTGVDLEEFAPQPRTPMGALGGPDWPENAVVIGCVAVLRSWKGHLYLVEALRRLATQGESVYLLIVGDGPYREVIQAKVAELGLQPRVWFAGYQEKVATWLAGMDIVVLASYGHEGVPQALLQALAMAKPVVGTSCGGIPEVVTPEFTGLLAPPRDAGALAAAIATLVRRPELRRSCGEAGRALVAERYSLGAMGDAVEKVYDWVAAP